jgi:sulfate adenylyltransferase subunit 1
MSTLLRLATAGSVDDGKSTLVGRLLHDCKAILADQIAHVQTVTAQRAGSRGDGTDFDFALLTDGLRAEREQGITIDVAYRYFATEKRSFILADCPGHVQYEVNSASGPLRPRGTQSIGRSPRLLRVQGCRTTKPACHTWASSA